MKKIFRNLKFGLMFCAGAFAASCSDVEEAMDDIPYTRVLTPLNFEAEVIASVGTDITFKWSTVQNADSYILELFDVEPTVSEDGEEVFTAPDYDATTPFATYDVAADAVPYTVKDLDVDKTFYARVRGVSDKVEKSHWAYLAEPVTTSAVRSMLNPVVTNRTEHSVTLAWDQADDKLDLTSIRYELVVPVEGATATTLKLEEEQKENCSVTIEGLETCTNYKFTLLFGKSGSRGYITVWTRPSTEGAETINDAEALYQAISGAEGDLKLILAYNDGQVYDLTDKVVITQDSNGNDVYNPIPLNYGLSLYGESATNGAKPVLRAGFISSATNVSGVHFEDLALEGGMIHGAAFTTGGSMTSAEFVNCEYTDFTKGIWSGADKCNVETLLFENVYAHDINATGSVGGDFIDIRGGNYGSIIVKNSTFYACARTFLRFSDKVMTVNDINVENCTFNQVTATTGASNNAGIFHIRHLNGTAEQATITGTFKMTKCVFLNEFNDAESESSPWVRLTRQSAENYAPTCSGNIYYNVGHAFPSMVSNDCHSSFFFNLKSLNMDNETMTEKLALAGDGQILAEDPCTNSIAGKMYLKANSIISANKAGDPRWWNASQPVVVRPTELETVTTDYTWDFTEKTIYDTETVETNQIIDNIRIYAPAEVTMSKGVTFAAAGTIDSKGVPTSSALGFRADGYGSVEITAQGTTVNSTLQIIAGGDYYSINADGAPHKVILGDLIGENDIYLLPNSAMTITKVTWAKNTDPEVTISTLATPEVKFNVSSVQTGTATAVSATWTSVAHAASYDVTFHLKKSTTAIATKTIEVGKDELTFDLTAAEIAAMDPGIYIVDVIAKPVPTSTKYEASAAGSSMFAIGEEKSITWDFTQYDGSNITELEDVFDKDGKNLGHTTIWNLYDFCPLTILYNATIENQKQVKLGEAKEGISGNVYKPTHRAITFVAPGTGSITYVHKSGKDTDETRRTWVSVDGVRDTKGEASPGSTKVETGYLAPVKEWKSQTVQLNVEEGQTIYLFSKGNNIQSVKYTYFDTTKRD